MMQYFAKIVDDQNPSTIFAKSSILDAWRGSEYASDLKPSDKEYST